MSEGSNRAVRRDFPRIFWTLPLYNFFIHLVTVNRTPRTGSFSMRKNLPSAPPPWRARPSFAWNRSGKI